MIPLHFEPLSRYDRLGETAAFAVPFAKGVCSSPEQVTVRDGGQRLQLQSKVTALWPDGSVKWLHCLFPADLPGRGAKDYMLHTDGAAGILPAAISCSPSGRTIDTGALRAVLAPKGSETLFDHLACAGAVFGGEEIRLPCLRIDGADYQARLDGEWYYEETGPYRASVTNLGRHYGPNGSCFDFHLTLQFTVGHPWFSLDYRFINREEAPSHELEAMTLQICQQGGTTVSTGISNYKTRLESASAEEGLSLLVDSEHMLYEANEHHAECFYGTFFADWRSESKGICVTIFQAQQNYPKAFTANRAGITAHLYPQGQPPASIYQGVAKTHRLFFHLHDGHAELGELNIRSLQMQLPDMPHLTADVYEAAGVMEAVYPAATVEAVETYFIQRGDSTARAYGMLGWGDCPDLNYTGQGRGGGKPVWINNEYDFSHANFILYTRTGERRFHDKLLSSARHWMDVDINHYSHDPLFFEGHIAHCADHVCGDVTPSHEWVEGLLDYYHATGEERALRCAEGIGRNVLRQLESEKFQVPGDANARETGWALRSLTALYVQTGDESWLTKCNWIVEQFALWQREFGGWFAPYTDHTVVRIPFMICIAIGSLMRYYRVRPSDSLRQMILDAANDLLEHGFLPNGLPYYKSLPSLRHFSINPMIVEAFAYAHELTGDDKYLRAAMPVFNRNLQSLRETGFGGGKRQLGDTVMTAGESPKAFAQALVPMSVFYKQALDAGLEGFIRS